MAEERRYWDAEMETMPCDKLRKLQEERLQSLVSRAYEKTALYRRKFDQAGIKPGDINTLDDLQKLPLTEYLEDFCNTPFVDKLAVPLDEVGEINSTSGTVSGFTQLCCQTRREIELSPDAHARLRWTMGVRPGDIVQLVAGPAEAYKALGATVMLFWAGRGNPDFQIRLAILAGATVLEHFPSLALQYLEQAEKIGLNIKESKLRLIIGVGETLAEAVRSRVKSEYGLSLRMMYASAEAGFIASECERQGGMHILADRYIVEIIDPQTKQLLNPGEEGEIVVTTLQNEAMPLIRYRMGDVGSLLPCEPCPCGRTHPRMSMVRGRVAHIMEVSGRKILPIDIEEVIASIPGLSSEYRIITDGRQELDRLKVKVEVKAGVGELKRLKEQAEEELYRRLGVESEVELVPSRSLLRTTFKAQRLISEEG
jgi:phenylacetate-CoA ligase